LILSLRLALPTYITSSFLSSFVSENLVGYIYILGSVFTLILFYLASKILASWGNWKTTIVFSLISFFSLIGLVYAKDLYCIVFFLNLSTATATMVSFCLDIFIEHDTKNSLTGNTRGLYLTIMNSAWLISPFLAGWMVGSENYKNVFLISAFFMLVLSIFVFIKLKKFTDPIYKSFSVINTLKEIIRRKDIRLIMFTFFLLQFFYAWMVIYMPIYLKNHLGFDWLTLGKMFTIMLLPFVFIQAPLGKIADKGVGEKKLLLVGFLIMAVSTFVIPFIKNNSFIVWSLVLFVTRIGAATVEVMSDTYFFKKIGEKDANLISVYRSMIPVAYIVGPIVAGAMLSFWGIEYLFYALAFLMLLGMTRDSEINDVK
jgi:MFS family permease